MESVQATVTLNARTTVLVMDQVADLKKEVATLRAQVNKMMELANRSRPIDPHTLPMSHGSVLPNDFPPPPQMAFQSDGNQSNERTDLECQKFIQFATATASEAIQTFDRINKMFPPNNLDELTEMGLEARITQLVACRDRFAAEMVSGLKIHHFYEPDIDRLRFDEVGIQTADKHTEHVARTAQLLGHYAEIAQRIALNAETGHSESNAHLERGLNAFRNSYIEYCAKNKLTDYTVPSVLLDPKLVDILKPVRVPEESSDSESSVSGGGGGEAEAKTEKD